MGQSVSKKKLKARSRQSKDESISTSWTALNVEVDEAWESHRFDLVLEQLINDSNFPKNFDCNVLASNANNEHAKKLMEFTRKRAEIHRFIEKENLQELDHILSNSKSKFYLNHKNESALYTAITHKKFKIYAFLKSIGAEFKDEAEESVFENLDDADKTAVENDLVRYYHRNADAPILYLLSKSRSSKPMSNFYDKVKGFYEKLDQIPETSIILQVIQHADSLDLVFDFDNDDITNLRFPCSRNTKITRNTKGECLYKEGRIYIAAGERRKEEKQVKGRTEKQILGTIVHELTHMAMELVYENECNPYYENDTSRKLNFERVIKKIEGVKNEKGNLFDILSETFSSYNKSDYASELIARVPQILAQNECGRDWLQLEANDLFLYYFDILRDFQDFINNSYKMKPKRQIRMINERVGDVKKIKKFPLLFKDVSQIQKFLGDKTKNIFLLAGESSWLCVLKSLQGLYKDSYMQRFDDYIVVKFSNFMKEEEQILKNFSMEGSDLLIVEYPEEDDDENGKEEMDLLEKFVTSLYKLTHLIELKPNKKIIIAVHESGELKIKNSLNSCQFIKYHYFHDSCLSLSDLDENSQKKILDLKIFFQNKQFKLRNLIEKFCLDVIDGKTIDELLSDEEIKIGSKGHGLANLDGAYANLQEEINIKILVDELINSQNTIFVFEGFKNEVDLESKINQKGLTDRLSTLLNENRLKIAKSNYSDNKFKLLCKDNPGKDIYWIEIGDSSSLILRKLYTPNFYLLRDFVMYGNLVIQWPELIECQDVQILISNTDRDTFLTNFYKNFGEQENDSLQKSNETNETGNFEENLSRIIFPKTEEEAQKTFEDNKKSDKTIYWFENKDDGIIYKNSYGSLDNLRKSIDVKNSTLTVSETEFIEKLKHNKAIIIADDPGMGKTTTLIKLSESQSFIKNYWITKVNLKDLNFFDLKDAKDADISYLFDYLSERRSGKYLIKSLLNSVIYKKCQIPLFIFFDGFDEIFEESDRNKIISWLKRLKEETEVKFLITTRFHCKNTLEDSLSTFALGFQPLDDVTKENFIKTYLKIRLNLILDKKNVGNDPYSFYTSKFLEKMASIFKTDLTRFIGTPLQLYLMLEDAVEHFKNWAQHKNFQDPDFSYFGSNMSEIYSNFINKKYDYFKRTKKNGVVCSLKDVKSFCDRFHMELAEFLTPDLNENKTSKEFEFSTTALACGIVKGQKDDYTFIHPTFREYYVAKLIMERIEAASSTEKLDVVVNVVLHGQNYRIVRCFLNDMFFDLIEKKSIPPENFTYFQKALNKLNKRTMVFCLSTLIQEEHANLFKFFILVLQKRIFSFTCRKGDFPLMFACRCNRKDIVECILEQSYKLDDKQFFEFLSKKGKSGETCLHHAAFYNNLDIVKLILDKAEERCSGEQIREFLTVPDMYGRTLLHLSASCLGQFFSIISQEFMKTSLRNSELTQFLGLYAGYKYWFPEIPYELLSENLHHISLPTNLPAKDKHILKFMKEFVEKENAKRKTENVNQLQLNASKIFELILSRITKDACSIICANDSQGCNVLNYAVANEDTDLIRFISEKMPLFQLIKNSSFCPIFTAMTNNDVSTFLYLLGSIPSQNIYDVLSIRKINGFNLYHCSVARGQENFAEMIINKVKEASFSQLPNLLHLKTYTGWNALHLAVENGHLSIVKILLQYAGEIEKELKKEKLENEFRYEYLISVNETKNNALSIAVRMNQADIAKLLLNAIPDEKLYETLCLSNDQKENVLHVAAAHGNGDVTNLILKKLKSLPPKTVCSFLFSTQIQNQNALQLAILGNHSSIVGALLQYPFNWQYEYIVPNNYYCNVIHEAIRNNYIEVIELILNKIPTERLHQILGINNGSVENILNQLATEENADLIENIYCKLRSGVFGNRVLKSRSKSGKVPLRRQTSSTTNRNATPQDRKTSPFKF